MTTYNTGNPLGSSHPKDLYDNAENLDRAVNSTSETWTDRLGVSRKTIKGVLDQVNSLLIAGGKAFESATAANGIVPEGSYFFVLSASDAEVFEVWKMGAGSASDTGKRTASKEFIDGFVKNQAADLFSTNTTYLFQSANLPVHRFTGAGTGAELPSGTNQSAASSGLEISIPAEGSTLVTNYFKTGVISSGSSTIEWQYKITEIEARGSVYASWLDSSGAYNSIGLSGSGNIVRFKGFAQGAEVIATGVGVASIGSVVRLSLNDNELKTYIDSHLVHTLSLSKNEIKGEVLLGVSGHFKSIASLRVDADPVRSYVESEVAESNKTAKQYVDNSALNLFAYSKVNLYPRANLPVRRYTSNTAFTDYHLGYSQIAVADGLKVTIPASGGGLISHHLRTGEYPTAEVFKCSFNITGANVNSASYGVGWVDSSGDYNAYVYSFSGVPRKFKNYNIDLQKLSPIVMPLEIGDKLDIEITKKTIIFIVNGNPVFSSELLPNEFAGELTIVQRGFNDGFVVKSELSSDPIRSYVREVGSQSFDMYVEVKPNERVTIYVRNQIGMWIGYPIVRKSIPTKNYDCWSFIEANEFQLIGSSFTPSGRFPSGLISGAGGVQEAPWKELGVTTDFVSGTAHGDEITESLILQIDGELIDPTTDSIFAPCHSARFMVDSIIYSNVTEGKEIVRRKRVYDFDKNGFQLDMFNTLLNDVGFTLLYHNALASPAGVYDRYYIQSEFEVKTRDGVERNLPGDYREYTLIGDNASCRVSILDIDAGEIWPRLLIASSNKPYFDLTNGTGANSKSGIAGDMWRIVSRYELKTF